MPFPGNPAGQTPANTFSPSSTPEANDLNSATYTFNASDNQWSTRDVTPTPPPLTPLLRHLPSLDLLVQ